MELTTQDLDLSIPIPIPLNSCYGDHDHDHDHIIHHHVHHDPSTTRNNNNNNNKLKHVVKYKECLKNHAASLGGSATDGCCEFMPSGEEGSIEALTCSACKCHRNFHRKEINGEPYDWRHGRKLLVCGNNMITPPKAAALTAYPTATFISSSRGGPAQVPGGHHMTIMPYNMGSGRSEEEEEAARAYSGKKRVRTKFTGEQKEKMQRFAEKAGWRIQREEESVVQKLCEEIGVKRKVLKVWMHNNKHINNNILPNNQTTPFPPNSLSPTK